jgi:hypothetical protein
MDPHRRRRTDPSRSPLADLERELRAIDLKRLGASAGESGADVRRFKPRPSIQPGAWADLERAA